MLTLYSAVNNLCLDDADEALMKTCWFTSSQASLLCYRHRRVTRYILRGHSLSHKTLSSVFTGLEEKNDICKQNRMKPFVARGGCGSCHSVAKLHCR